MNEVTQYVQEGEGYKVIHPSLVNEFEADVLDSYILYAEDTKNTIVTHFFHNEVSEFASYFNLSWHFAIQSLIHSDLPESEWANVDQTQYHEYTEKAEQDMEFFDEEVVDDIINFFNQNRLFYIKAVEVWDEGPTIELEVIGWENSPIQEIW